MTISSPSLTSPSHADNKVLIVGYGITGQSYQRYCQRQQLPYAIYDTAISRHVQLQTLQQQGITYYDSLDTCNLSDFCVLFVSPGVSQDADILQAATQQGIDIENELDLFFDTAQGKKVAISGSNGKSTITAWLTSVLKHNGKNAIACGNIGLPLLDALHAYNDPSVIWVMELSSFQLERRRRFQADIACLSNISADHLDRHKQLSDYYDIKLQLLQHSHCNFLADNLLSQARQRLDATATLQLIGTVPAKPANDYSVDWFTSNEGKLYYRRQLIVDSQQLFSQALHNQINALFVSAMAYRLVLNIDQIGAALVHWHGLEHRFQTIASDDGIRWINDSKATNLGAVISAVLSARQMLSEQAGLHLLLGGDSKGVDFSEITELLETQVQAVYFFGKDAEKIAQQLHLQQTPYQICVTLEQVLELCLLATKVGDMVLLAPGCASFDQFANYQQRGNQFRQWVTNKAANYQTS